MSDLDQVANKAVVIGENNTAQESREREFDRRKMIQLATFVREHHGERISTAQILRELNMQSPSKIAYYLSKLEAEGAIECEKNVIGAARIWYRADSFTKDNITVPKQYKLELTAYKNEEKKERRAQVAAYVQKHSGQTFNAQIIADALNISQPVAYYDLQMLMRDGFVTSEGQKLGSNARPIYRYHSVPVPFSERTYAVKYSQKVLGSNMNNGEVFTSQSLGVPEYWKSTSMRKYFLPVRTYIKQLNGRPTTISDVGRHVGMALGSTHKNMTKLEKRGWVSVHRVPGPGFNHILEWHDTPIKPQKQASKPKPVTAPVAAIPLPVEVKPPVVAGNLTVDEIPEPVNLPNNVSAAFDEKIIQVEEAPEAKIGDSEYEPYTPNVNQTETRRKLFREVRTYLIENPNASDKALDDRFLAQSELTIKQFHDVVRNNKNIIVTRDADGVLRHTWRKLGQARPKNALPQTKIRAKSPFQRVVSQYRAQSPTARTPAKRSVQGVTRLEYYLHLMVLTAAATGTGYAMYGSKGGLLAGSAALCVYAVIWMFRKGSKL